MRYVVLGPDDLTVCSPPLYPASQCHDVTRRKQKHFVACDKEEGEGRQTGAFYSVTDSVKLTLRL